MKIKRDAQTTEDEKKDQIAEIQSHEHDMKKIITIKNHQAIENATLQPRGGIPAKSKFFVSPVPSTNESRRIPKHVGKWNDLAIIPSHS